MKSISRWENLLRIRDFCVTGTLECHFVSLALKLLRFVKEFQSLKKVGGWDSPPLKQPGVNNTYNHYGGCTEKEMRLLKICSLVLMNARDIVRFYSRLVFETMHFVFRHDIQPYD